MNNKREHKLNLKFGLMCDGDTLQAWQAKCVRALLDHGLTCELLIVDDNEVPRKTTAQKISGYLNHNGLYHLYQRLFFRPKAKFPIVISSIFNPFDRDAPFPSRGRAGDGVLNCKTTKKKYSEYFSEPDIQTIKSHQLDFILRFGFNIIRGEILNVAKYGIWSFHHDDEQKYRGGPPGFWEIIKDDSVTGVILQRLTDKLDGGIILKKGFFKTIDHSYAGQIDQLYFGTATWPLQVCRDIENGVEDYLNEKQSITTAKVFNAPKNLNMLAFWLKIIKNKVRFHFSELYWPEDWNVGISETSINLFTEKFEDNIFRWLPQPPNGRYYADPFGFMVGDELHILFEDYDYKSRKGKISKVIFSDGKFGDITTAIREDFHLSYPYVFNINGDIYCVPESADAGEVRLYKYNKKEDKFEFSKILMKEFPGVDPVIFKHQDKWWLFATHKDQSNTSLFAFFANDFDGPYFAHTNNPVKVDVRSSRPAGTPFMKDGSLIRPAQDCSKTYGGRIALNKIVELTENTFKEETIEYIGPIKNSSYGRGFHTLSAAADYTIFDGKRFKFIWGNFRYKLKMKLGIGRMEKWNNGKTELLKTDKIEKTD